MMPDKLPQSNIHPRLLVLRLQVLLSPHLTACLTESMSFHILLLLFS